MNIDSDTPAVDIPAEPGAEPAETSEPKKRAPRPRKPKADASVEASAAAAADETMAPAAAPDVAAADADTAVSRPKRARRSTKAVPDEAVAGQGPVVDAAPAPMDRGDDRADDDRAPAASSDEVRAEVADDGGDRHAEGPDEDGRGEGGEGVGDVGGDGGGEAEPRGRRRNRRRRGQRRDDEGGVAVADGERADGAAPDAPVDVEFSTQIDPGEMFAKVVSGDFDVEPPEGAPKLPSKRVLPAEPDSPKLQKVLAQAGVGSRRDMETLIADGRITVNGEAAHIGQRISFGDQIRVAGKPIKVRIQPPLARVLAYHKPAGEVVTNDDPQHRPTVFRRLPRLAHGKWQSVGRLDINTEGLLLFTNSGDLANKLMHPRFGVEREYAVRVLGTLDDATRARLIEGVPIDGQPASFKSVEDGGGDGANRWYRVVITEGRNREVRKLFDAVGMAVSRLIRIRYGSVVLPKGLRRGVWIDLEGRDVVALKRLAGADSAAPVREPLGEGESRPAPSQQLQQQPQQRGPRPDRGDRGGRPDRGDRPLRNDRVDRPPRPDRPDRQVRNDRRPEDDGIGTIPNPLQQTYDRRPLPREVSVPDRDETEDNVGPIPNPLQQTFDKRFVQKPRGPGGGQRDGQGGNQRQPDPMQTSLGYIGADTFMRKLGNRGGPRRKR